MKPSEKRALRELEAQKKKQELENSSDQSAFTASESEDKLTIEKKSKSILDDDVVSMRKEGFFQSNVRLITFIICIVVFLGAATIIPLVHWMGERTVVRGEETLTLDDVIAISKKKQYITWDDLENYIHVDHSHGKTRDYMFSVEGTTYVLMVTGPKSDKIYPDSVVLCDLENTSYSIDLTRYDIKTYLSEATKAPSKNMKLDDVRELSKNSVYLRWSDLSDFKFTEERKEATPDKQRVLTIRVYPLEDADFSVWVYGETVFGTPEKIILVDNNNSKKFVDLTNIKETEAFINENILDK